MLCCVETSIVVRVVILPILFQIEILSKAMLIDYQTRLPTVMAAVLLPLGLIIVCVVRRLIS